MASTSDLSSRADAVGRGEHDAGPGRLEHGRERHVGEPGVERDPDGTDPRDRELGDERVLGTIEQERHPVARGDPAPPQVARQPHGGGLERHVGHRAVDGLHGVAGGPAVAAELVAGPLDEPVDPLVGGRGRRPAAGAQPGTGTASRPGPPAPRRRRHGVRRGDAVRCAGDHRDPHVRPVTLCAGAHQTPASSRTGVVVAHRHHSNEVMPVAHFHPVDRNERRAGHPR